MGSTLLERADAPMGVVFGKLFPVDESFNTEWIRNYCSENKVEITASEVDFIQTSHLLRLSVMSETAIEIEGQCSYLSGNDSDGFDITIEGIPCSLFITEFEHHWLEYVGKNPLL